ncbi:hybrid sensor histidine kinase/response regulator [Pseudaquabacterium pictum]|uniref:Virulence sensor protein BvgS n=1 Tax=Pseudaquabacterium pictum TaxID=2315236 RepID=A0A480AT21_9BURK|nr:ATP-binding protein [Rubrivivax pictus]GCL64839.1 hypothetical protein AQPW35_39200 [Rubrivivax pictus]
MRLLTWKDRLDADGSGAATPAPDGARTATAGLPRACLWLGVLYLALALLSLFLSRQPGSIANIWYANAIAIPFFVRAPPAQWPLLALTLVLVNPLANMLWGDDVIVGLSFLPANLAEILVAAWLIRCLGLAGSAELSASQVMRWILFGGVVPQLVGATLGSLTVSWHGGTEFGLVWLTWFEGAVVGALSLLPLALFVADRGPSELLVAMRDRRLLVLAPLTVGVTLVSAAALPYPFVYIILPLLVAAAIVRFAAVGVLTALASFTLAAALGLGILVPAPITAAWQEVFIYLAFAAALIPAQVFSATTRDLRRSRERLRERTAELQRAREAAESASRAKGAFLAVMSHEIRTPMNGVLGTADVLARTPLSDQQASDVQVIRSSALSLLALIDDILDFSKIEAGRLELERVPVGVEALAQAVCETLHPVALTRGVDVLLYVDPSLPAQVRSDPIRLRQILFNLVGNAIKFSAGRPELPGKVSVRLERAAAAGADKLLILVRDNGIGMPPESQARIFGAFEQADAGISRQFAGTGLGLAIVKRLVTQMGGDIEVRSALGHGACFEVRLPLEPVADGGACQQPRLAGVDAFVVGDDERSAVVFAYLQGTGASVHRVADMAAAVRMAGTCALPVLLHTVAEDAPAAPGMPPDAPATDRLAWVRIVVGRRCRPAVTGDRTVTLDGHCVVGTELVAAVATVAGLERPEALRVAAPLQSAPADGAMLSTPATAGGITILVAEDDAVNQIVVVRQLASMGYAAEVAGTGTDALRLWREGRYALLLTDLQMPGLDGYALVETIRRAEAANGNGHGARMPILALTANAFPEDRERAKAAGVDAFLTKPLLSDVLQAALQRWLPVSSNGGVGHRDGSADHLRGD